MRDKGGSKWMMKKKPKKKDEKDSLHNKTIIVKRKGEEKIQLLL